MPTSPVTPRLALGTLLALACLLARPAAAHEFWLSPSTYRAAAGDTVRLGVLVGTGFRGEPKPYAAPRTLRFAWLGGRALDLTPVTLNGDLTWAQVVAPDAGGALIAFASNWADLTLPAPDFDAYLKLEGLTGPLAARARQGAKAGPGRERYARCPKCWISGDEPARATRVVGLPLELVPASDPSAAGALLVQVLYRGKPLAGATIRAWNRALAAGGAPVAAAERDSLPPVAEARTDANGVARLDVSRPGEWLLSCVHMVPSEDRAEADWQSLWASLSFARAVAPR